MAAHIGSTGASEGISNFERLTAMIDKFPSLAVGISSLTQVNRRNTLVDALQRQQLTDRMHYGTDWPLQFFPLVSPLFHLNHISWREARSIVAIDNAWDRDVALKEALGVPSEVFERTSAYFSKRPDPKHHKRSKSLMGFSLGRIYKLNSQSPSASRASS